MLATCPKGAVGSSATARMSVDLGVLFCRSSGSCLQCKSGLRRADVPGAEGEARRDGCASRPQTRRLRVIRD